MVSLARSMLRFERRRFLPAVLAVAFAGLLMLVQLGLLLGLFATISVYIDRSGADLWAGFPGAQSIDLARTSQPTTRSCCGCTRRWSGSSTSTGAQAIGTPRAAGR